MVDGVEEPGEAEGQTEHDTNIITGGENQQEGQQGQDSPGHPTQASSEDNGDTQYLNPAVTEGPDAGEAEAEADVGEVAIEGEEAAFEGQEETAFEGEEAAFEGQEETAFEGQEETAFEGQEETAIEGEEATFVGEEEAFEGQEETVAADTDFHVNEIEGVAGDTELHSGELEPGVFEEGLQPGDPGVAEVEVEGDQEEGDIDSAPGEEEQAATTNEQDGDLVEQMVEEEGEDPVDDSQLVVDEYEHEGEQDHDVHLDGVQEAVEEEEEEIDVGTEQDTLSHAALVQYGVPGVGEEGAIAPVDEDPLPPTDEEVPLAHADEEGPVAHADEEGPVAHADEEGNVQGEPGADYHLDDTAAQDEVLADDVHHELAEQIDEQTVYHEPEEQPEGVEEDHHAPEDQTNGGQEAMGYADDHFEVAHTPEAEEAMEVDETPALAVNEPKDEYDINGIDAEEEDLNDIDEDQEMSPQDLFNIAPTDDRLLPQCRLKRNYSCTHCGFTTQNPREHLYHLRDDHGERMKVFECPRCIYASKNQQKLIRHARMVHKLKIKRASESTSPYKRQAKSPRAKVSPSKSARDSMSPGKSSRSSPGKSPRSSEYDWGEGMEDEEEEEVEVEAEEESPGKGEEKKYFCPQCDYTCKSRKLLNKHETSFHLKRRFFRCQKCNYVTHLKGRYTKHMKYHQLPILKCEYCDFRTPYRWNLDRHMKNHTEDCGEFKCHLCNFTAQIKQSLTVHISNHHLTAEQIREKEMRRTIGISDPADCTSDDQENELMRMERDEHPEALMLPGFGSRPQSPVDSSSNHLNGNNSFRVSNIDVSHQEDPLMNADDSRDDDGEPRKKKPKIKMTLTKMKLPKTKDTFFQELNERHNFEEDFIHPDDVVHRHGNVYIKTFKCQYCPFKAAFQNEIARHEKKLHTVHTPKLEVTGKAKKTMKALKSLKSLRGPKPGITENNEVLGEMLQFPRSFSSEQDSEKEEDNEAEGPLGDLKVKEEELSNPDSRGENSARTSPEPPEEPSSEHSMDARDLSPSKDPNKKKGQSFFEKLQEKIPTSNVQNLVCQFCGHESKCLSESVRHQKLHLSAKNIYASASLSTRCQFCRHRCKTTDDLITHLKLCPEARKNQITDSGRRPSGPRLEGTEDGLEPSGDRDEDSRDSVSNREPSEGAEDEDKQHPMENRVFVWNKWNRFQVQEDAEQNGEGLKLKDGTETIVKDIKKLLPEAASSLDDSLNRSNSEETLDYIESQSPKGNHYYTKRVYRCPQCSFWATTASRFHVHIVGHFNKKPYNCSECGYKSNWRWDITKHIKLKTSRDNSHQGAQVIITDETGEKNYEKYDCYLTIIQLDEPNAHRTEGGIPTRKGRPKRTPEKEEDRELATPSPSPKRKPPMVSIPVMPRFPGLPRLTRAPGTGSKRPPGPMPFGPMMRGAQMMVQMAGSAAAQPKPTQSRPPPPLTLRGASKQSPPTGKSTPKETTETTPAGAQYQIITPQGAVNTSLETLQLLASGSTNLTRLKKQHQKGDSEATEEKDRQAAVSHQVSVSSTGEDGREVSKMVLDHEGNPEWKCHACDFRDSERETVNQHVRLAHGRGGPVSLLHAVHRCDVCGYAAGTKRAVQMHIDSSHGGQGGITSRSEGQTPEPKDTSGDSEVMEYNESLRRFQCRQCPYSCKKRSDMRSHQAYHAPRPDCIFKCMFCPYYVPTKGELFEHLNVHGMEVPGLSMDGANKAANSPANSLLSPTNQEDGGSRNLVCDHCPFESRSRAKLMHHRQFHKPKGLPYRCPHCSYNVTRRHLLSQHIRVHGVDHPLDDSVDANDTSHPDERSNSPSPSLTITPVNSVAASTDSGGDKGVTDSSLLPKLTDQSTMVLSDIPLVWVSRDNRFFKMFKCRHCPHVNLRKTNIQEHEKMHKTDAARESGGLHCPYCTYVSINAGVMSAHMKVHAGSMGQCHAVVDPMLSDEDQLRRLTTKASTSRPAIPQAQETPSSMPPPAAKVDEKLIYYCQQCPARFFFEKEIQIHTRFHTTILPYKCEHCDYGARQQPHLLAHMKVHTPEYQERTRTMMAQHRTAASYPFVPGLTIPHKTEVEAQEGQKTVSDTTNTVPPTASPPPTNNVPPQPAPTSKYKCDQCPASFSKLLTLQYHQSLHGGNNANQCHRCSYTSKTAENLQQHMLLHSQDDERVQAENYPTKDIKKEKITEQVSTPTAEKPVEAKNETKKTEGSKSEEGSKPEAKSSEGDPPYHPPIKLKLIGLRPVSTDGVSGRPQFKYYVEEQIPLSGVDLLKRKTQLEKEGHDKSSSESSSTSSKPSKSKSGKEKDAETEDDPKRIGDPNLYYPMHIDKVSGKTREKRYKCSKCPSAFEKTEQYFVHSNLHGSNHKYKCRICDYSVKFYANFMMHINRHKYHERMLHQNSQGSAPNDLDPKYEPVINNGESAAAEKPTKAKAEESNKENLDDVDMTTSERQHLLLQNKKGVKELTSKDEEKEKRVYYCQFCPYANVRRDAVDSHSLRHQANGGCGVYKCTFCDYTASQPNFIREHTKVHFRPFKYVHPEGFMRHDRQEILSTPIPIPGSKVVEGPKTQDTTDQDKYLIFAHNAGIYKPPLRTSQNNEDDEIDSQVESGIEVNFHSGDIVDAPSDFVISLRVTKSKNGVGFVESGEHYAGEADLNAGPSTEQGDSAYPHTEDGIRYRKRPRTEGVEGRDESMDVDVETVNSDINESQKNQLTNGSVQGKAGDAMESDMDGESPKSKLKGSIAKSFKTKANVTVSSH